MKSEVVWIQNKGIIKTTLTEQNHRIIMTIIIIQSITTIVYNTRLLLL